MVEFKLLDSNMPVPRKNVSGWDIAINQSITIPPRSSALVSTGLAVGIPKGYVGQLYERKSMFVHSQLYLACPLVHHGFFGEISLDILNNSDVPIELRKHDIVAQLVVIPFMHESEVVQQLSVNKTNVIGLTGRRTIP